MGIDFPLDEKKGKKKQRQKQEQEQKFHAECCVFENKQVKKKKNTQENDGLTTELELSFDVAKERNKKKRKTEGQRKTQTSTKRNEAASDKLDKAEAECNVARKMKKKGSYTERCGNGIFDLHASSKKKKKRKERRKHLNEELLGTDKADLAQDNCFVEDNSGHDDSLQITVSGPASDNTKFRPILSFEDVPMPQKILACCKDFQKPSPIQAHAWPFLLDGQDLIGIAATGSGKTLAFGLPALAHVLQRNKSNTNLKNPLCLVLSPTRELAQQISEVLVEAGCPCGVNTVCLYGGSSKQSQLASLKAGVAIIVATPGRLVDVVEGGHCSLEDVSYVVLDEADRMLDLGFEHVVRKLIGLTSKRRQMVMFSATWPAMVDSLSKEFMKEKPIKVIVGSQELAANHAVTQIIEVIDHTARDARLVDLLNQYHKFERNRVLVFVLYKKEAARVESLLQQRGWNACAVHGDKDQAYRNKAVMSFKDGTCPLLVATDVAARGLDIPDVEYVINYSFPLTTEDYVHRIGRTGRAGKRGIAHTFFTCRDKARTGELVNVLKEAGQWVPDELLKFGTSVKKKESMIYGAHFKDLGENAPKATKIIFDSDEE